MSLLFFEGFDQTYGGGTNWYRTRLPGGGGWNSSRAADRYGHVSGERWEPSSHAWMNTGFGEGHEDLVQGGISGDLIVGHHFCGPSPTYYPYGGFLRFSSGPTTHLAMLHCTGEQGPGDPFETIPHRLIWYYDPTNGQNWEGGQGPYYNYYWDYGEWAYLEHRIGPSGLQMRRDGGTVLSGPGRAATWVTSRYQNYGFEVLQTDNLYVLDTGGGYNNDFLGECRVITLWPTYVSGPNTMEGYPPNKVTSTQPWASFGAGYKSNYLVGRLIDFSTYSSYLLGGGGTSEWFKLDLPYAYGTIRGLQVVSYWKGNGDGNGTALGAVMVGGNVYYPPLGAPSYVISVTDDGGQHGGASIYELNPATGQPWTWDDVFALSVGIQALSSDVRCYSMACQILISSEDSVAALYQAR